MNEPTRNHAGTEFFLPLLGPADAMRRVREDPAIAAGIADALVGSGLAARGARVEVDPTLRDVDWLAGTDASTYRHAPSRGYVLGFLQGRRDRDDSTEDYFDHLDPAAYVSRCHTGLSPSRNRIMRALRRGLADLLGERARGTSAMPPGTRETALCSGAIMAIRHEVALEASARGIKVPRDWRTEVAEEGGHLLVSVAAAGRRIGPIALDARHTGVGAERFVATLEAADGRPVSRTRGHEGKRH